MNLQTVPVTCWNAAATGSVPTGTTKSGLRKSTVGETSSPFFPATRKKHTLDRNNNGEKKLWILPVSPKRMQQTCALRRHNRWRQDIRRLQSWRWTPTSGRDPCSGAMFMRPVHIVLMPHIELHFASRSSDFRLGLLRIFKVISWHVNCHSSR